MFTGIVEGTGVIQRIRQGSKAIRLVVRAGRLATGVKVGDSVAVNGCCLTVVKTGGRGASRVLEFDLLVETWQRTSFSAAATGALVNLERSLPANGRLGGHFVTGHIDGVGRIVRWERAGQDHVLDIQAPPEVQRYIVFKGSVAVDGISLTVAGVNPDGFRIWIIPHTFEVTALRQRKVGDLVNLEADLVGKYIEQFLQARSLIR